MQEGEQSARRPQTSELLRPTSVVLLHSKVPCRLEGTQGSRKKIPQERINELRLLPLSEGSLFAERRPQAAIGGARRVAHLTIWKVSLAERRIGPRLDPYGSK